MLEGSDIGRIRFCGENMGVGLEGCIFWNTGAEVDTGGFRVGSPRVGAHFISGGGSEPFGFRGKAAVFPFRIGVGAGVIDGKYGCIPCDTDLIVVLVPFAGTGEHVLPSDRFQI